MSLSDFHNAYLSDDATPDEYREWLGREKKRIDHLIERLKVPREPRSRFYARVLASLPSPSEMQTLAASVGQSHAALRKARRAPDELIKIRPCEWTRPDAEFLRQCGISPAHLADQVP